MPRSPPPTRYPAATGPWHRSPRRRRPEPYPPPPPLPAPTDLRARGVRDTTAELSWSASGLSDHDVVQYRVDCGWCDYGSTCFGQLTLAGLAPATVFTFRVYSVPVAGLGYTESPP